MQQIHVIVVLAAVAVCWSNSGMLNWSCVLALDDGCLLVLLAKCWSVCLLSLTSRWCADWLLLPCWLAIAIFLLFAFEIPPAAVHLLLCARVLPVAVELLRVYCVGWCCLLLLWGRWLPFGRYSIVLICYCGSAWLLFCAFWCDAFIIAVASVIFTSC